MTTDTAMTTKAETGKQPKAASVDPDYASHEDLKRKVDDFIDVTQDARALSERCRDYYDGKQWTEAQTKELKRRKQAPIVNNRIKVKQNGLLGLMTLRKAAPKAFPRNQETDSGASEAATDGLRYAADKCNLNTTFTEVDDNFFCEGYGGVHTTIEQKPDGNTEVAVDNVPWDRCFYDPYSRKNDFSDARYKGFMMWMDEEDIEDLFPDAEEGALNGPELSRHTTFDDRPDWFSNNGNRRRHLVATIYYKWKGKWCMAIFTGSGYLLTPQDSPWMDEYGEPECPLEFVSAYTDRDNNRYGELASFLDLQDEINHRRSKALFLLSQRQTFGNRGAMKDVKKAKSELAKPDGHLEINQGEFNKDFGILPTGDMAQGQFELLQEAKAEIDAQSYNAQLSGQRQQGDLSGKAIGKLQQAGVTELNVLFDALTGFRLRVYRQMWNRIRQFWDQEKWVRVTDDQKLPKYVGFNVPMTMREALQDVMDDESKPPAMRLGASAQMITLEQQNPQALDQIVEVKNKAAELDMDIILDESFDSINASQEQLDAILQFGAGQQFDIIDLLEISNIQGKRQLIEKIEARRKEASESAGQDPQSQLIAAKTQESGANAAVKQADAEQTQLETQILQATGGAVPFKGAVSA